MTKKLMELKPRKKMVRATVKVKNKKIDLALFVSGMTPKSIQAIGTLKKICEAHLVDRYSLEIIDVYREPQRAKENDVFAVPTLIKLYPPPRQVFIGDMSDVSHVLRAFGIKKEPTHEK